MDNVQMEDGLHVAVFPWLAMGHLIPFFNLSKHLAEHGHTVSFLSTPRNLLRLPKIPPRLSSRLALVAFPLPEIPDLPPGAECASDVPFRSQSLLKTSFDLLEPSVTSFLRSHAPDWILYDYAPHWLLPRAADLGVSRAFVSLFNAAWLSFLGPPAELIADCGGRSEPEHFTVVPKWIPFESALVYRRHEIAANMERESAPARAPATPDAVRFGLAVAESDVVVVRSCSEFEPEWFDLLAELYGRPVLPLGFLPPAVEEEEDDDDKDEEERCVMEWLDSKRVGSVIYVAFGTEASPTGPELTELALGLEQSGLDFFWVLRDPPEPGRGVLDMLPDGFLDRVTGRGSVHVGWAPQARILGHGSVRGFLTHCGWNSVVEGLGCGRVLILFPVANDQGINARLLAEKGLGVEIPRDIANGSFTSGSVAKTVRLAMVDDIGESLRVKAREMKGLFGDRERSDRYLGDFIRYLEEKRKEFIGGL